MQEFDVVGRIQELCQSRSWTYYRLAKASGIPYSTLSTMLHKANVPSIPSLIKICDGFGITLAQFFSGRGQRRRNSLRTKSNVSVFGIDWTIPARRWPCPIYKGLQTARK